MSKVRRQEVGEGNVKIILKARTRSLSAFNSNLTDRFGEPTKQAPNNCDKTNYTRRPLRKPCYRVRASPVARPCREDPPVNPWRAMLLCKAWLFLDPGFRLASAVSHWLVLPRTVKPKSKKGTTRISNSTASRTSQRFKQPFPSLCVFPLRENRSMSGWWFTGGAGSAGEAWAWDGNWCFFWVKSPGLDRVLRWNLFFVSERPRCCTEAS